MLKTRQVEYCLFRQLPDNLVGYSCFQQVATNVHVSNGGNIPAIQCTYQPSFMLPSFSKFHLHSWKFACSNSNLLLFFLHWLFCTFLTLFGTTELKIWSENVKISTILFYLLVALTPFHIFHFTQGGWTDWVWQPLATPPTTRCPAPTKVKKQHRQASSSSQRTHSPVGVLMCLLTPDPRLLEWERPGRGWRLHDP